MRKILILVFVNLAFITLCMGQQNSDSLDVRIKVLVDKIKNKTISEAEHSELIGYVYRVQSKGFALEEKQHDFANSLIQIEKATALWEAIGDTLSIANLLKYKGVLYGKLKQFDKGKRDLNKAISLFKSKQYESGVAVSYHDYSILYDQESKIDSALFYETKAVDFWNIEHDSMRIVVSNSQFINLYLKQKKFDTAIKFVNQTDLILKQVKIPDVMALNFYYISYALYNTTKNVELAKKYKDLYTEKIEGFKKDNIMMKSMYE